MEVNFVNILSYGFVDWNPAEETENCFDNQEVSYFESKFKIRQFYVPYLKLCDLIFIFLVLFVLYLCVYVFGYLSLAFASI
jgi:hypothetical protein